MSKLRIAAFALALGTALVPARLAAQATELTGPDTVVFNTSRGTVTFLHAKHAEASECSSCHHESRPEKPLETERQKCRDCHTEEPVAPMATSLRNAMHDTEAREGTCFTCHKAEAAKGVTVPTRCADCHVRVQSQRQR